MNKKAASLITMLVEVVVVALVVFLTFQKIITIGAKDAVTKITIAEDMAMMVNTLVATPGNAVVAYPHNLSQYSLLLNPSAVRVITPEKGELQIVRSYNLPEGYTAEGLVEKVQRVCLEKSTEKIILRGCQNHES